MKYENCSTLSSSSLLFMVHSVYAYCCLNLTEMRNALKNSYISLKLCSQRKGDIKLQIFFMVITNTHSKYYAKLNNQIVQNVHNYNKYYYIIATQIT